MKYKLQPNCTVCNKIPPKTNILYLKKLPITEILFKKPSQAKIFYDQKIKFCSECEHLSLTYLYDTAKFYNDSYMTSSTKAFSGRYANDIFYEFINKNLNKRKLNILEIGANDLYLLNRFYKDKKINKAVAIDPTGKLDSNVKKIKIIKNFFEKVSQSQISFVPDVVICGHTLEHIENPLYFLKKVMMLGNNKTKFFFQYPSCESLINRCSFDQIHHQHFNLFSLKSTSKILGMVGAQIKKFDYCEEHYGALMVYFEKQKSKFVKNKFIKIDYLKFNLNEVYSRYKLYIKNLTSVIKYYKKRKLKIYAIGGGLMLPIINYQLNNIISLCNAILDDDKEKIGKYFPNLNIRIKSLRNTDLKNSLVITTSTASSISTRKINHLLFDKKPSIIINPSLTL
jgi:cyclopropane-fatty-acyl-phospholipid synthase